MSELEFDSVGLFQQAQDLLIRGELAALSGQKEEGNGLFADSARLHE